jgi:hypothetical protein
MHGESTKIKEGIFIGPQILVIIYDDPSEHMLRETEKSARLTFRTICVYLVGNLKAESYKEIFEDVLSAHQTVRCNTMSLKTGCLHYHLKFFTPNLGPVSDKHGERFHQDFSTMQKRYVEKSLQNGS